MKKKPIYNIEEIRKQYEFGVANLRQLALFWGIPYTSLRRLKINNKWKRKKGLS